MENGKAKLHTNTLEVAPNVKVKARKGPTRRRSQSQAQTGKKKKRARADTLTDPSKPAKRARKTDKGKYDDDPPPLPSPKFKQPSLITGATLKDYQLEGVEWMIGLDQNGVSGILGTRFRSLPCIEVGCGLMETPLLSASGFSGRDGSGKGTNITYTSRNYVLELYKYYIYRHYKQ